MNIAEFLKAFGEVLPLAAIGYAKDAVGLQIGFEKHAVVTKILLAYEITDEVIDEAIGAKVNLIVCYHPLIFPNISSVTDSNRTGSLVRRLIKNDIALYVIHTAFDSHPEFGTSRLMADALGLSEIHPLQSLSNLLEKIIVFVPINKAQEVQEAMWEAGAGNISNYDECGFSSGGIGTFRGNEITNPAIGKPLTRESVSEVRLEMICEKWKVRSVIDSMLESHPYEEVAYDIYPLMNLHPKFGMGSVGKWEVDRSMSDALAVIAASFQTSVLRHNNVYKNGYCKVAMLGGAGMEFYLAAKTKGADIFITGDIRYHDFYRAKYDNVLLVDAGHAETERFVVSGMLKAALRACNVVNLHDQTVHSPIIESAVTPNVVSYYHKKEKP